MLKRQVVDKLSPPPKVRTERNLQNSRLNPTKPVLRWTSRPDSGQMGVFAQVMRESRKLKTRWRRGWDSNPRTTFAVAGFQDRCLQPLGHPSVLARRSIHNVSGGGIVRKVPLSGAIGSTLRTASHGTRSGHPRSDQAYSLTGCHSVQVKWHCGAKKVAVGEAGPIDERPGKLQRHRSIGRHPHPKAKTARVRPRAVSEIAIGQRPTTALRETCLTT